MDKTARTYSMKVLAMHLFIQNHGIYEGKISLRVAYTIITQKNHPSGTQQVQTVHKTATGRHIHKESM